MNTLNTSAKTFDMVEPCQQCKTILVPSDSGICKNCASSILCALKPPSSPSKPPSSPSVEGTRGKNDNVTTYTIVSDEKVEEVISFPIWNPNSQLGHGSETRDDPLLLSSIFTTEASRGASTLEDLVGYPERKPKALKTGHPYSNSPDSATSVPAAWPDPVRIEEHLGIDIPQAPLASSSSTTYSSQYPDSRKRMREAEQDTNMSVCQAVSCLVQPLTTTKALNLPFIQGGWQDQKTFSNQIENMSLPHELRRASARSMFLRLLFRMTSKRVNELRVIFERNCNVKRISLWTFLERFSKQPEIEGTLEANKDRCKRFDASARNKGALERMRNIFGKDKWDILQRNIDAHRQKVFFQQWLDSTKPLQDEESCLGIFCPICCNRFSPKDTLSCNQGDHSICVTCFHRYVTETIRVQSLSTVSCLHPRCHGVFSIDDTRRCLSQWDQLRIEEREEEVNVRVALASQTLVECKCGFVGVVQHAEGMGDKVCCPCCLLDYCAKCGNEHHQGQDCRAPPRTMKWVRRNTKSCPNCAFPIEKNGGCNHMFCPPPFGGGTHFNYESGNILS